MQADPRGSVEESKENVVRLGQRYKADQLRHWSRNVMCGMWNEMDYKRVLISSSLPRMRE